MSNSKTQNGTQHSQDKNTHEFKDIEEAIQKAIDSDSSKPLDSHEYLSKKVAVK